MRAVPVRSVRPGTLLGKTLFNASGNILLKNGVELTEPLLQRLEENGIFTVYVDDGYSSQEIHDIIQPEVKVKAIQSIKTVFELIERAPATSDSGDLKRRLMQKSMAKYLSGIRAVSAQIIESILTNQSLMINLVDIKSYDNYAYEHSLNVAVLSLILGIEAKLNRYQLQSLFIGALLHDIGKTLLPASVSKKKGLLTEEESELLKTHALRGYEYLAENKSLDGIVKSVVLQHHERYNGGGYPRGTHGDSISIAARIAAIANTYDRLTSDTPTDRAKPPNEAMEYLMGSAGTEFDFRLVELFVRKIIPYPPGTLVKLSNGQIGVVQQVSPNYPLRPVLRYVARGSGKVLETDIDLMQEYSITITGIQTEDPRSI